MIQTTSLNPAGHQLSDKSSKSKSDEASSGAFLELLNQFKEETDRNNSQELLSMISGLFSQINEQINPSFHLAGQEPKQENEQQTRNEVMGFISSLLESKMDPNDPALSLFEKDLYKPGKLAQLLSEVTAPKDGTQAFQKAAQDLFNPMVSEKLANHEFDFHRQFEGKEVIFQSVNPSGHAALAAKHEQGLTPRVSVDQFYSEVMGLVKHHSSLKTASSDFIEAKFSLTPEKLGEIDVKLSIHKGQVVAHFTAETLLGKEALESQISLLRSSLSQQGFQVDKIEISQSGQGLSNSFSGQEEKSRQEQSRQHFAKKKINAEEFYQSHTTIEDYTLRRTENTINILA